ncbi:hypothetical protein M231_06417 [Tremella mesenterica]|uniref:Uncharacterized protein n=1 Tax=Tremella mesenterica TaxID=5217 RepID=A0A4Q1BG87_TREME|nr:hypothetical protein M231_06417 [Tremella mesenterica]
MSRPDPRDSAYSSSSIEDFDNQDDTQDNHSDDSDGPPAYPYDPMNPRRRGQSFNRSGSTWLTRGGTRGRGTSMNQSRGSYVSNPTTRGDPPTRGYPQSYSQRAPTTQTWDQDPNMPSQTFNPMVPVGSRTTNSPWTSAQGQLPGWTSSQVSDLVTGFPERTSRRASVRSEYLPPYEEASSAQYPLVNTDSRSTRRMGRVDPNLASLTLQSLPQESEEETPEQDTETSRNEALARLEGRDGSRRG